MNSTSPDSKSDQQSMRKLVSNVRKMLKEPILEILIERSALTEAQIETLLIDLVLEDSYGTSIAYENKASLRTREGTKKMGVSRGAFNRTLGQARKNVTKSVYTLLLMAYLGLFDMAVFRPFEEIASRIGGYRMIREVLAGKTELSSEEMESYHSAERLIISALEELDSPLVLKTDTSKRKAV